LSQDLKTVFMLIITSQLSKILFRNYKVPEKVHFDFDTSQVIKMVTFRTLRLDGDTFRHWWCKCHLSRDLQIIFSLQIVTSELSKTFP